MMTNVITTDASVSHGNRTYWGKTHFEGSCPPWKLEYMEGKGYYAVATRAFKAGDLICIETPTTWCPGWHPFNELQIEEIKRRVEALNEGNLA